MLSINEPRAYHRSDANVLQFSVVPVVAVADLVGNSDFGGQKLRGTRVLRTGVAGG